MKRAYFIFCSLIFVLALSLFFSCGKVPTKQFFLLNYQPEPMKQRLLDSPYPYTVRVRGFGIEEAYNRPQIVYRKSPFQMQYYFFKVWAVKPVRMITDMVDKHLTSSGLVSHVIRRFDEGGNAPNYELSGHIDAIEEYDSEDVWFAHLALRLKLIRTRDNRTMYMRHFDRRKRVHLREPEYVVREMSQIMDFIMTQAIHALDGVLAKAYGVSQKTVVPVKEIDKGVESD
jgi:ABC-type uncharacterized transport system auxiliary subunit